MVYGIADNLRFILVIQHAVYIAIVGVVFINDNALKRPAGVERLFVDFRNAGADINRLEQTVAVKGKFVYRGDLFALVIDNAVVYLVAASEQRSGVRGVVVECRYAVNGKADDRAVV